MVAGKRGGRAVSFLVALPSLWGEVFFFVFFMGALRKWWKLSPATPTALRLLSLALLTFCESRTAEDLNMQ